MAATKILIMRHGEKPDVAGDINLSPAGLARAKQLVSYIPTTFGRPQFLFATQQSKDSNRPVETLEPLSQSISVDIDSAFADHQYRDLAAALLKNQKYDRASVLICWHHEKIPKLSYALGASSGTVPDPWDDNVYNLVLVLDFTVAGGPSVSQVLEPF
jgi:broad specificity phosphatase PhoE